MTTVMLNEIILWVMIIVTLFAFVVGLVAIYHRPKCLNRLFFGKEVK